MNTDRPVVLIHGGESDSDSILYGGLIEAFPNLGLRKARDLAEIRANLPETEVLFAWSFPFELLSEAPKLRWLQLLGAGVERLRGLPMPDGLTVTNLRGVFGPEMAEYVLAYFLAHAKRLSAFSSLQAHHRWEPSAPAVLRGRTVGIAGLGSIGRVIAQYCAAVGMEVIGLKRTREPVPEVKRLYVTEEIDVFLGQCDYLVLVMPGTSETERLLTRERFHRVKPGCFLASIGRGSVMDEADLIEALHSGRIAGAVLDVFAVEPLPESSPLWDMSNVSITPHISGINRPRDLLPPLRENLRRYLKGEPLLNRVDLARGY